MNRAARIGALAASAILVAAGTTLATPGTAEAATGCSGRLIESIPLKVGKTKVGSLAIYYNSATGMNCAKTNHGGVTWNKRTDTLVEIYSCKNHKPGQNCVFDKHAIDYGRYRQYAGPVSVYGKGKCIAVHASIWWNGDATAYSGGYRSLKTTHCG